ncbi:glycosyltransferase [Aliivibrio fischeri]|uniref:glycosyltransferase n=1 Tax=Aliivibrio fischeri TaxID=668 RepID=UPI0012DA18EC|nr:glycosyltransferase [Aliivibrio fischeri]MUJ24416.1 glycosyltransferase [Aliivibrio fischeri]
MIDIKSVILRTEDEIVSSWIHSEVVVSIICATYNHENYLEDTIVGFLMQETDFPFEVVIHDDASTDNTAKILAKYVEKYPRIIKPIYQKENQFSKGGFKPPVYVEQFLLGRYIAICEGDDYWINRNKLQIQKDILEEHSDVGLCFSKAIEINEAKDNEERIICDYNKSGIISSKTIIYNRGGSIPSASIMLRRELFDYLRNNLYKFKVGDFFIQSYFSIISNVYYINEPLTIYRRNGIGSWTSNLSKSNENRFNNEREMLSSIVVFIHDMRSHKKSRYLLKPLFFYYKNILYYVLKNLNITNVAKLISSTKELIVGCIKSIKLF